MCVIDSGVEAELLDDGSAFTMEQRGDEWHVVPDAPNDTAGHGTACAGIIRSLAPDCRLTSVRILTGNLRSSGQALAAALSWAIQERFQLINLSLSTRKPDIKEQLHDMADTAWYSGVTLVTAAHNSPVISYPWRFPSVLSVGSHAVADAEHLQWNPTPPVDFFAYGVDVPVNWIGGATRSVSGNSFAAPHVTGMCARILEAHPKFGTSQLRIVLSCIADNLE
ncbi:S8 family serine peptidase [Glycomyces sp. L485]|nr:S8 family serine peptidase [Glycomyces sp. L485]